MVSFYQRLRSNFQGISDVHGNDIKNSKSTKLDYYYIAAMYSNPYSYAVLQYVISCRTRKRRVVFKNFDLVHENGPNSVIFGSIHLISFDYDH